MTERRGFVNLLPLVVLLALAAACALLLMSASLHPEAATVRDVIDSGIRKVCQTGIYVAPASGRMLLLSRLPTGQMGGQIIRFFEYRYNELVPTDTIYECTAFACGEGYWCRVIKRDGYILLMEAKRGWILGGGIFIALGALCAWLRKMGRHNVADAIEDA